MSFARAVAARLHEAPRMQTSQLVRDPDGVPHDVVGLTWVFAIGVAIVSFIALRIGGALAAAAFGIVPFAIISLDRRARRERAARRRPTRREARAELIDWRGH